MKLTRKEIAVNFHIKMKTAQYKAVVRGMDSVPNNLTTNILPEDLPYGWSMEQKIVNQIFKIYWQGVNSKDTLHFVDNQFLADNKLVIDNMFPNTCEHNKKHIDNLVIIMKQNEFAKKYDNLLIESLAMQGFKCFNYNDIFKAYNVKPNIEVIENLYRQYQNKETVLFILVNNLTNLCNYNTEKRVVSHRTRTILKKFLEVRGKYNNPSNFKLKKKELRKLVTVISKFGNGRVGIDYHGTDKLHRICDYITGSKLIYSDMSFDKFEYLLEGIDWFVNTNMTHNLLADISPSVMVTLGRLPASMRWAALFRDTDTRMGSLTKSDGRYHYVFGKRDINWERVKEIQDLTVAGKHRMVLNHITQPTSKIWFKDTGMHLVDGGKEINTNLRQLNMFKKAIGETGVRQFQIEVQRHRRELISFVNIFGVNAYKLLEANSYSTFTTVENLHQLTNKLGLKTQNKPLDTNWQQFFFNNTELATYSGFVREGMPLFKSVQQFQQYVNSQVYSNVADGMESLTQAAARNKLDQDSFENYQDYILTGTNKKSEMLPFIRIDGNDIPEVGHQYTLDKLDVDDPTALMIGLETDCCQHLQGVGAGAAIASWEFPDYAVYVLRKNGQIIAQTLAWVTKEYNVVFDSIEIKRGVDVTKACIMFRTLAEKLVLHPTFGFNAVKVGNNHYGITREMLEYSFASNHFGMTDEKPIYNTSTYLDGRSQHMLICTSEALCAKAEKVANAKYTKVEQECLYIKHKDEFKKHIEIINQSIIVHELYKNNFGTIIYLAKALSQVVFDDDLQELFVDINEHEYSMLVLNQLNQVTFEE